MCTVACGRARARISGFTSACTRERLCIYVRVLVCMRVALPRLANARSRACALISVCLLRGHTRDSVSTRTSGCAGACLPARMKRANVCVRLPVRVAKRENARFCELISALMHMRYDPCLHVLRACWHAERVSRIIAYTRMRLSCRCHSESLRKLSGACARDVARACL
eukprot:4693609-Pleurochrysis_carterae.AAC.2